MIPLLKCFLQINLLLAASILIFRCVRWYLSKSGFEQSYQALTRVAQCLMSASIFIPLVFACMPVQNLPQVRFELPRSPIESMTSNDVVKKMNQIPHKNLPSVARGLKGMSVSFASLSKLTAFVVSKLHRPGMLALFLAGLLMMIIRLIRNVALVNKTICEGIIIRQVFSVVVVVSDAISAPFSTLIGFKAYIVVSPEILTRSKDLRIAIRHELQHHRQWDTIWALLIEAWVCLFYFNPAIYFWKKEITELQEFSCDEALIGQRRILSHDYGSCLIRVAEAALGNRQMLVGTACMAAATENSRYFKSFLRRRIEMFSVHETSRRKKTFAIITGTLGVLATLSAAYGTQQALRSPREPNSGKAVFDQKVQSIAEDVLSKAVQSYGAKGGFVLVSDPNTGRLLAAANFSKTVTRKGAWSLSYLLEPASVIKGIVAAKAIDNKLTNLNEIIDCEDGSYFYGHNLFHDWKPFGKLTTSSILAQSSNIGGIKIGERLGSSGLSKTLSDFGFGPGGSTEGFPEAEAGILPPRDQLTEEEYVAMVSIGYTLHGRFDVTPLEMVQAYGAIANGGKLMKAIGAQDTDSSAKILRQVLSAQTSQEMRQALQNAVQTGTGRLAQSRLYTTAGKTGTAFTPGSPDHDTLGGERSIASFAGFAPVTHPKLAIYVGIIDPTNSADHQAHGNEHAAPVFREVTERVLQELGVMPDKN